MKNHAFLIFCLLLSSFFTQGYFAMRMEFNGVGELDRRIGQLSNDLERERLKARLATHQLSEYRQEVATLIPGAATEMKDEKDAYQLRVLASVVTIPDSDLVNLERAGSAFERAKRNFREEHFDKANAGFKTLIEKYPGSIYVPEAHFLLVESQFQAKEYEGCIDTVESMLSLFPESELTGFALLRLGKIYEVQDRLEDAVEVYRTIQASYQDRTLKTQADSSLKAVEL